LFKHVVISDISRCL